ncbi:inositol polyphosphate 5-phosphatase [Clonorchis sinensis]|uniref:Inositol polyphosphate 5-phosphatase n=1 Tax=Clonorchis sinensis TaxID=79923 RepID=A0A8T1MRN9_CLOSI|nr:inositol polyphosphate 5-phosphatase [Clonorchis sinensis]
MLPWAGLSTINFSTWEMNVGNNFNPLEEIGGSLKASESSATLYSAPPSRRRQAHAKNFLIGSTAGLDGSMLGSKELTRIFPAKNIGVHIVTWNMASQKSHKYPDDLTDLCYPISTCESAGIFAICLQEVSPDKNELLIRLQATLGPRHVLFSYAFQGTLGLLIFLSRDLIWYTSVPQSTGITTRANIRTKGAVAICFILFGTSLLFVSSHFKANPGNLDLRINDYKEVVRSLNLPKVGLERGYRQKNTSVLDRFDAVFWAGDLNFRLRKTRRQVENMLRTERKSSAFEHLLNFDELVSTQLKGQIFQQFEEGRIRFPPTYKYDINSDDFDTSEKCRVPAYTDRILYRVQKKGTVNSRTGDGHRDCVFSLQNIVWILYGLSEAWM